MIAMRRFALLLLSVLLLSSCASVLGPRTIAISQEELQQKIAKLFPLQRQLLEVFNATVETPTLTMLPQSHRVALDLGVSARDRLMGHEYHAALGTSFGLRFDPDELALKLVHVSVDKVNIDGLPQATQRALMRLGAMVAEDKLEGYTVHRFRREEFGVADKLGYTVGAIDVTPQGLVVNLVAKP